MGRLFLLLGRVFAWTPRPPYDFRELLRQMVRVGVDSIPVVFLTAMFTGMVMSLETFTTLRRFYPNTPLPRCLNEPCPARRVTHWR